MTLGQLQREFAFYVGKLLLHIHGEGYAVTFGEAYRPQETAAIYAKQGRGIKNSLHTSRLAIDLNLFKEGTYLTETADWRDIGEWWERQHPLARWGGRFGDGNHFSFEYGGVK